MPDRPPIWIVVRKGEDPKKCTVAPLRGLPGIRFFRYPLRTPLPLADLSAPPILLAPDAPPLSPDDAGRPLLFLDANWRWAPKMQKAVGAIETRSIQGITTAYPRTSKSFDDPDGGLATVEAIVAALQITGGVWTDILDTYVWRDAFLTLNAAQF